MKPSRIATGFDRLAPVYTALTRLVFRKSLEQAQEYFLNIIRSDDHVLILGGGSGKLLKSLREQHPRITMDYIDISPRMIALAKKKTTPFANVNFIVGTEQDIPNTHYSVVITNFYLDLFLNEKLSEIAHTISKQLSSDARWLVTDFVQEKRWHKIMLWIMYRFFRITTGIEAHKLPDWQNQLKRAGLTEVDSKHFFGGFIKSSHYIKA